MNKPRINNCILALLLSGAVLTAPSALALSAKQAKALRQAVTSVPAPEMPAKAAQLVQEAKAPDRIETAITVVRAAVSKKKASGPIIVAAISKIAPDLAATVAAVAAQMVSDQSAYIAQAAIAAAPGQSSAIVAAMVAPIDQVTRTDVPFTAGNTPANRTSEGPAGIAVTPSQIAQSAGANASLSAAMEPNQPAVTTVANIAPQAPATSANATPPVLRPSALPTAAPGISVAASAPRTRGEADVSGPSSGTIVTSTQPINTASGGRGDGLFPSSAPSTVAPPHPKAYDQPR